MDFPADFDVEAWMVPLREKFGAGKVVGVMTVAGPVAFRRLTGPEYDRCLAMRQDPASRHLLGKTVCLIAVVSPDRAAFEAMIAEWPGIVDTCDDQVWLLTGVDPKAAVKK